MKYMAFLFPLGLSLVVVPACKESKAHADAVATVAQAEAPAPQRVAITKIAFLDKAHGCECTTKRVDAAWAALQSSLTGRALEIERIHVDTQADKAESYNRLRATMVLPTLYFLDKNASLVDVLQGEVTAQQIQTLLDGAGKS